MKTCLAMAKQVFLFGTSCGWLSSLAVAISVIVNSEPEHVEEIT
jgi:hypothetical protein